MITELENELTNLNAVKTIIGYLDADMLQTINASELKDFLFFMDNTLNNIHKNCYRIYTDELKRQRGLENV